MNYLSRIGVAAIMFGLVGCGGGSGGDSATVPVANSILPPVSNKLTIEGAVTDDPIANAAVSFMVGDREYAAGTLSDVNGGFSIDIEYDSLDDIVCGSAVAAATGIHLVGEVMTVRDLVGASTDGVYTGVAITNLTTAQYVLAQNNTSDGSIDSMAEFEQAARGIDSNALFELGAAIKVVVEGIGGTVLPGDALDTLDLAKRIANGTSTFISDVEVMAPGTMAAARTKLLSDGYATLDFKVGSVPGVYVSERGDVAYALFADRSGLITYYDDRGATRITDWVVTPGGELVVELAAHEEGVDTLTLLARVANNMQFNSAMRDGAATAGSFEVHKFDSRFNADDVAGTYRATDSQASDFVINVGGSGFFLDANGTPGESFAWQITGDGRLVIRHTNRDSTLISRLANAADGTLQFLSLGALPGGSFDSLTVNSFVKD